MSWIKAIDIARMRSGTSVCMVANKLTASPH
jgi:hypothetical protein